eukprot:3935417-Amphidinium_carterae.1
MQGHESGLRNPRLARGQSVARRCAVDAADTCAQAAQSSFALARCSQPGVGAIGIACASCACGRYARPLHVGSQCGLLLGDDPTHGLSQPGKMWYWPSLSHSTRCSRSDALADNQHFFSPSKFQARTYDEGHVAPMVSLHDRRVPQWCWLGTYVPVANAVAGWWCALGRRLALCRAQQTSILHAYHPSCS